MPQQKTSNGEALPLSRRSHMGTTITAVLLLDETAYVANVGDSRTYLSTPQGLSKITQDHSLVARLLANGMLEEEEIYTHVQRNQITRSLGTDPEVEVDTFVVSLPANAILLLCSDGLWEMTRDGNIEAVLAAARANPSSLSSVPNQLIALANAGGGADNIGCLVVQTQQSIDSSALPTAGSPVSALTTAW